MKMFRHLRADEIECRVHSVKANGLVLLLYKDARCDMNILDETVGAYNWERSHARDNANCTVSIYDVEKKEWISKEDTGTESNTEAEKGLASDSFKRACVNWGIGRELYSSPFIWINKENANIQGNKCYDRFVVKQIEYSESGNISGLLIYNASLKRFCYEYGSCSAATQEKPQPKPQTQPKAEQPKAEPKPQPEPEPISKAHLTELANKCIEKGIDLGYIKHSYKVDDLSKLCEKHYIQVLSHIDLVKQRSDEWKQKQN